MEIRPILSALMRSKVALVLIGLQIALTLAIVCNALFIINQRFEKMARATGMNEADTFFVQSLGFGQGFSPETTFKEDLAMIRALPGVVDASPAITMPLSDSGWSEGVSLTREQTTSAAGAAVYFVDEHGLDAYGVKLASGRNFRPEEIAYREPRATDWPQGLILTKALAKRLFPDTDPVGKQFFMNQEGPPITILGVVEKMEMPWPNVTSSKGNPDAFEYSMFVPQMVAYGNRTAYVVRAEPGRRDEVIKAVETKMAQINPNRIVRGTKTMEKIRVEGYHEDRAMTIILGGVIGSLLLITALGIVGMASFWVTQRTKQIGTRRALGATRFDILRYFLTENFLITTLGLVLGAALAYGFNYYLITHQQAQVLPIGYVAFGFVALWVLGQLAVLGPATRASNVAPAVATRSV